MIISKSSKTFRSVLNNTCYMQNRAYIAVGKAVGKMTQTCAAEHLRSRCHGGGRIKIEVEIDKSPARQMRRL